MHKVLWPYMNYATKISSQTVIFCFKYYLHYLLASAERSFSALKRLKTWLRNRMTQERLLGLAFLHIHLDLNIDIENVMNRFAKLKRRIEFIT
ncbi:hypothetical protein NQ314_017246 [Rhamnusium bicolor]|uniref:HAT C-terminal dimerisation domain-containing protein n=1 Tax=Rhamnusium bicolor TaxID=1586634 RepID=A0AAV8WTD6_9CUCU|nr:hypothetical protein NQ314_017246 [Rhamnusium bicolor]